MFRKLTAVVILIALLLSAGSLSAQGGLTDEEIALLQRYADAIDAVRGHSSYVDTRSESQTQVVQALIDGAVVQEEETSEAQESTTTVIRGDNPSGMQQMTVTATDENGAVVVTAVELRYVDGVLYGSASYTEGEGEVVFPAGFVEIDPESPDVFEEFEVDGFMRVVFGERDEDNPLLDFDTLVMYVDSVSSGEGELDGVPMEVITLTVPASRLYELLLISDPETFGTPQLSALFAFISDEGGAQVMLYLDENGNPLANEVNISIIISGVALTDIDPNGQEGVTLDFTIIQSQAATLTQINEELPAITAP